MDIETSNTPDEEAHKVAAALGLPAAFDPTLRPLNFLGGHQLRKVDSGNSEQTSMSRDSISPDSRPSSPEITMKSPKSSQLDSPYDSAESEGEDDEEGEFEVSPGHALLLADQNQKDPPEIQKKMKLHEMEVGEAKALLTPVGRKASVGSRSSDGQGSAEDDGVDQGEEEIAKGSQIDDEDES